jgi:hypothetical protein
VIIQEQALKEMQARMGALEGQLKQARRQGGGSALQRSSNL